ncbi:MAG: protein kinase [Armatimonadota bacterium]|nr:protein kinase [Armatimonadota bacterium]
MIGQVVNYRYEILEKCGDGNFFTVYKARDKVLNRLVAVKILLPHYAANRDFAERVIAEAQAASGLSHQNIAKVYEADHQDDTYFIALEYIRGLNLKDRVRRLAPFSPALAVDMAIAIAEALDSAHHQTITHGDLRPKNVIVSSDSQVKLTDFGMAAAVSLFPNIQTNCVLRSVHYMSPEVAEGKVARPASDIYSLGVILYEMLTGAVPFDGDTAIAVALRHAKDPPPPPRSLNAGVPKAVESIVLKALAKAPEARYRNVQEMLQDLRAVRQQLDAPVSTRTQDEPEMTEAIDLGVEHKDTPGFLSGALKIGFVLFAAGLVGLVLMILYLFFGLGSPAEVAIPLMLGKTQTEAETLAREAGVSLTPVGEEVNEEYPPGQIYLTVPEAGMRVKRGQTVKIWISRGSRFVRAPDVAEMTEDKARTEITDSGLIVGSSARAYSETVPLGSVVKQSPAPGTQLERGQPVKLTVSMGPEPKPETVTGEITPPDSTGAYDPGEQREFKVTVKVPTDGNGPQTVRITVEDDIGESVAYEQEHEPGDVFDQVVTGSGQIVTIRTFVNDNLIRTYIFDKAKGAQRR